MKRQNIDTDVLVIGGAGAGLRAAVAAAEQGVNVVLASKFPAGGTSNTSIIAGWFTRATEKSEEELFYQVVYTGGFLNNQRLVDVFAKGVITRMPELTEYGVDLFATDASERVDKPGHFQVRKIEGKPRGYGLTQPLRDVAEKLGVQILDNVMVTELLTKDNAVVGATAVDVENEIFLAIGATSTILATGGGAGVYERNDNAEGTTGDGFSLAFRAGAELVDIECISFNIPRSRLEELFSLTNPPSEELLQTGTCHYFLGGVKIDEQARSSVEGLYAAGEVTGGLLGAARLGGSAMADTIVFGVIAGENAAERAKSIPTPSSDATQIEAEAKWIESIFNTGNVSPEKLVGEIKSTLWRYAGTMKTGSTLKKASEQLETSAQSLNAMRADNMADARTALEVRNMLDLGRLIVTASEIRKETRGCYWRIDYPEPDNENWLKNITVWKDGEAIKTKVQNAIMTKLTTPTEPPIGPGCFGYTGGPFRKSV